MSEDMSNLSWSDRFALINHYNLSDQEVMKTFGVTEDEYNQAKELLDEQVFTENQTLEVSSFSGVFGREPIKNPMKSVSSGQSASQIKRPAKKRGKKGDKITKAFESITGASVPVTQVQEQYGVSLAVLRQAKRFDKTGMGTVHVRKDKDSGELMIWRETAE